MTAEKAEPGRAGRVAEALLSWFRGRERDVPWRGESRPYRVWVAEVMAQQTRLGTVREYYGPFLERFPDVEALAEADQQEVLKAWEGLGYYARARNLHRAARKVVEEHDGRVPREPAELQALPGVGPYTAGAVASLAFGRPEPAVDGNTRRVLSRLWDLEDPGREELEAVARRILRSRPGEAAALNQALMDLGGEVCAPTSPRCAECPARRECLALERGTVGLRPPSRPTREIPHHDIGVGIIWRGRKVLVARRPEEGLLGGLWEFPGGKVEAGEEPAEAVQREAREELGVRVEVGELAARVEHAYSHLRVTLHAYHALHRSGTPTPEAATALRWVRPGSLRDYPFPAANHRIIDAIEEGGGPPAAQ